MSLKTEFKIGLIGWGKLSKSIVQENAQKIKAIYTKQTEQINGILMTNNLEVFLSNVDVIIDCSIDGFDDRSVKIDKPIIIATTQIITKYPKFYMKMPNGSFSWNLLHETCIKLAKNKKYNFIITEIHHQHKKDAPSGTAMRLINELKELNCEVNYTSSRGFEVTGTHTITAYNNDECIKFEHQAHNRKIFAQGLLFAAEWISQQTPGIYLTKDLYLAKF